MDFFSVLEKIFEEIGLLEIGALVLLVFGIYYLLFRKVLHSIFDPLTYVVMFSSFTSVLLVVLLRLDVISAGKLAFSFGTLLLFYGAFLLTDWLYRPPRRRASTLAPRRTGLATGASPSSGTLAMLFVVNTVLRLTTYVFFGIPVLLESRLSLFAEGGGVGALGRLTNGLEFASLMLGMIALKQEPHRRWAWALIVQFVVTAVLSGSKGALLNLVFAWYLAGVFYDRTWLPAVGLGRRTLLLGGAAIASVPLFIIGLQSGGEITSLLSAAGSLAVRFIAEGDGYVYFFGGDLIDRIAKPDWLALVRPVFTGLRLTPVEFAVNPGFEVIRELFGVDTPSTGPNSRLPIYLLYFYGPGGILLAPLLGSLLGWGRNRLLKASGRGALRFAVLATVYLDLTKLEVDPQITVNGLFDLLLVAPVLVLPGMFVRQAVHPAQRTPSAPDLDRPSAARTAFT